MKLKKIFCAAAAGTAITLPTKAMAATGVGMALGPVTFAAPWVLLGLATLPVLWHLMRSTPPKPRQENFPAIRILLGLDSEDQEPARMPLWQRIMRISAAGLIIAGLAQPDFDANGSFKGDGPVVLVVDNGWAAASGWNARTEEMKKVINRAEREGRELIVLQTAAPADGGAIRPTAPMNAAEARRMLLESKPQPWPVDRNAAAKALGDVKLKSATSVIWLSNGLNDDGAMALAARLQSMGSLTLVEDDLNKTHLIAPAVVSPADPLAVTVKRAEGSHEEILTLTASDDAGRALTQVQVKMEKGETEKRAEFVIPSEIRAQMAKVTIEGEESAGAVALLDERWRRRPVGIIDTDHSTAGANSLLNDSNFIDQALAPYVELRHGDIEKLLESDLAVMVMTDSALLNDSGMQRIDQWVRGGGTLLRFAGPNMAAGGRKNLLPVELRGNVRANAQGTGVAPFDSASPFHGIQQSEGVQVDRNVMALNDPNIEEKTWARMADGTPLVTAKRHGDGWTILVHTTAGPEWSNLSLSGMFVDMMRSVVSHSRGIANDAKGPDIAMPPIQMVDGTGRMVVPAKSVAPLTRAAILNGTVGPQSPPGFYGNESVRHAHNIASGVKTLEPMPDMPKNVRQEIYKADDDHNNLAGPLLGGAMALLLLDILILMGQRGLLPHMNRKGRQEKPAPRL